MTYDFDATPTLNLARQTVTTGTTLTDAAGVVFVDTSSGAITVTLPVSSDVQDQVITIVKAGSPNAVTVDGNGKNIGPNSSIKLHSLDDWITVSSDGANWDIIDMDVAWRSVSAFNAVTTTATDADVPNMLVATPGKGRYRIVFSCNGRSQNNNKEIEIVIFTQAGATLVKAEESRRSHAGSDWSGLEASCEMTITDDNADVKAGFTALGGGTAEIEGRVLAVKFLGQ